MTFRVTNSLEAFKLLNHIQLFEGNACISSFTNVSSRNLNQVVFFITLTNMLKARASAAIFQFLMFSAKVTFFIVK